MNSYSFIESEDDQIVSGLVSIGQTGSYFYGRNSKEIRSKLTEYFAGVGSVPFQYSNV